jgi:plasmid stabilization system protein ParE
MTSEVFVEVSRFHAMLVVAALPYIVAYVARRDRIYVLRVLHGAMKWPERF